jgi:peptidoglycan/LPS O-acetylase OafA/YrhL
MALDSKAPATRYSPLVTRALIALAGLFFIVVLLVSRGEVLKVPYGWQYLLGVAFALVLVSLASGSRRLAFSKPSAYLADFSYSVYLIHFPVLMLVISVVFSLTGYGIKIPFGAGGLIWFAVVFAVAILFAWMVSLVTEARTGGLREVLYRIFRIEPRITPINTKI